MIKTVVKKFQQTKHGIYLSLRSVNIKLKVLLISALISISFYANAEIEYYDCQGTYWKFDLKSINNISPYAVSGLRFRQSAHAAVQNLNVEMSDEWFKAHPVGYPKGVWYINRTGGQSFVIYNEINSNLGRMRERVCKNVIKDKDLDAFFKTDTELDRNREKIANQPPAMNWN